MKNTKLNIHYMYLFPFLILQICATSLVASVMSVEDYGMYTLYMTTINLLYFMTLGVIDGYTLENRKKNKKEIGGIPKLLFFYSLMVISLGVGGVVIALAFDFHRIYFFSLIAAVVTAAYHLTQTIFRTLNEVHKQNIYVLMMRLCFLSDGVIYLITNDLGMTILFDIMCRVLIVLIAVVHILLEYKNNPPNGTKITEYIKLGFLVTVSNTIFNLTLMIDKYALSNDLENLGIYSLAITGVLMLRVIIAPLNQVLFVTIDETEGSSALSNKIIKLIISSFLLLLPALYFGKLVILSVPFLGKYESAIPIIAISILIVPLMIPVESIILNINKIKGGRLFLIKSIMIAMFFAVVLFTYASSVGFSLTHYTMLVVLLYFSSFVVYSSGVINIKHLLYCISLYLSLSVVYIYLANLII